MTKQINFFCGLDESGVFDGVQKFSFQKICHCTKAECLTRIVLRRNFHRFASNIK